MITLLNQPWAERLGWTLLHFLWQGILVAALYALARALAGGRMSARGRYAMACAALLAMTAAPAVTYWWLGTSGHAAPIGDLAGPGARPSHSVSEGPGRARRDSVVPMRHTAFCCQEATAGLRTVRYTIGTQRGKISRLEVNRIRTPAAPRPAHPLPERA